MINSNSPILLSWGDPKCVREALYDNLPPFIAHRSVNIWEMGYPDHNGSPDLIKELKVLAERQSKHRPKHLFVTNGATGAINAALYALKTVKTEWVVANKRYYPVLPGIINSAGLIMCDTKHKQHLCDGELGCTDSNFITFVDSPSAPEGLVYPFEKVDIFDAAYASRTYTKGYSHIPSDWKIMVGSIAKTLGLPSLRIGWVSTDNDDLANSLKHYVVSAYSGVSLVSQEMATGILKHLDKDKFEKLSASHIDDNREQIQKLFNRFGNKEEVPTRGMFAVTKLEKSQVKALNKANIVWQVGPSWGETEEWARFSLGQNRDLTKEAVRRIVKNDKI